MNKLRIPSVLLAATLAMSACSSSTEEPETIETPTSSTVEETPQPNDEEEDTQVPPVEGISVNDDKLDATVEVEGFTSEDAAEAAQAAKDFALVGLTSPIFYTGEWWDEEQENIASLWEEFATSEVVESIASLNPKLPEDGQVLASIAPIFREESENVTVIDLCADGWENCVSEDIVFSDFDATVSEDDPRLQVSFSVNTSRLLVNRGEPAHSDIAFEHLFWMVEDDGEWKVDAFSSSYEYGEVITSDNDVADFQGDPESE